MAAPLVVDGCPGNVSVRADSERARRPLVLYGGSHDEVDNEAVEGQIAEGPRWWRGELSWEGEPIDLRAGTQITLGLDNGRGAAAVVEAAPASDAVAVRGIEPPPFAVP